MSKTLNDFHQEAEAELRALLTSFAVADSGNPLQDLSDNISHYGDYLTLVNQQLTEKANTYLLYGFSKEEMIQEARTAARDALSRGMTYFNIPHSTN